MILCFTFFSFSKTYPSFLTVKEGSTSHLGLLPSGKKRETALLCAIFSNPSVSLSKGSSTSNQAFSIVFTTPSVPLVGDRNLRRKDVTALLGARNHYALRLADPQRSTPGFSGWDRMIMGLYHNSMLLYHFLTSEIL